MTTSREPARAFFGGPDLPPRALRDLLEERVDGVPAGGWIDWATYYFRDRALAEALVRARRRGAEVWLSLEAAPRREGTNDSVASRLRGPEGLGAGLALVRHAPFSRRGGRTRRAHLHTKLYAFSHPHPHALVGSFNPSGDVPEDPGVLAEIGDQDRGHNALLEIDEPATVAALRAHLTWLRGTRHGRWERLAPAANRVLRAPGLEIFFHPRVRSGRALRAFAGLGTGDALRIAASHLRDARAVRALARARRRGAEVELIVHASERRSPEAVARRLRAAGVRVLRHQEKGGAPMHHKFALIERGPARELLLGSLNWTPRSLSRNHEIVARVRGAPTLFDAFAERFAAVRAECADEIR